MSGDSSKARERRAAAGRGPSKRPGPGQGADAPESRERILNAALREFSANGLAGARTERIAAAAGVNKALLYYYFAGKEKLYQAALEAVAGRVRASTLAVLKSSGSAGERVLRAALSHFDRILTQREFQSLMQQEMLRLQRGEQGAVTILAERIFRPLLVTFQETLREGIASGELIEGDLLQYQLTMIGANVFYFLSAPVWQIIMDFDPFSPKSLMARRVSLVQFLGQAIFQDRKRGQRLAEQVLKEMPAPAVEGFRAAHAKGWNLNRRGKSK